MNLKSNFLAIILAAGKGSRLNSSLPKPLYKINGVAIIDYLIDSISQIKGIDILTVVGYKREKMIRHIYNRSMHVVQKNPRGTGHALMKCLDYIRRYDNVFVFIGDILTYIRVPSQTLMARFVYTMSCTRTRSYGPP